MMLECFVSLLNLTNIIGQDRRSNSQYFYYLFDTRIMSATMRVSAHKFRNKIGN